MSAELESKSKNSWDFKMSSKEEWRQSHPAWICCSQQEKPEKGTEGTPAPKRQDLGVHPHHLNVA